MISGNAAKVYCLRLLEQMAAQNSSLRILDLGCGTGENFAELLRRHPAIRYTGLEPSARACERARSVLPGARIIQTAAYNFAEAPHDVVVSFSVLEHVYRRTEYLGCAKRNVTQAGRILMNYDAGHFVPGASWRDRLKTAFGGYAAAAGQERWFQRPVRDREIRHLLADLRLEIVEDKVFNTCLKRIQPLLPEGKREDFTARWVELELFVNEAGVTYSDERVSLFNTRNLVLARSD